MALPPSLDAFEDFIFGCGVENQGRTLIGSASLLGLGREKLSFIQQTAHRYKRTFSYCLPSSSTASGFLTFGREVASTGVKYIPLVTLSYSNSLYGVELENIAVNGIPLGIPNEVFSSPGTIVDSKTVLTRLPKTAYSELRSEFRRQMMFYGHTLIPLNCSLRETCYNFRGQAKIHIPRISFIFVGGIMIDLDKRGILYAIKKTAIGCFAFRSFPNHTDLTIIGNIQQRRIEVVYDIAGGRVGFRPSACV